jgi:hypothetical protein
MLKIIIRVDESVAKQARFVAARQGATVSGLVNEMLAEKMREERRYRAAKRRLPPLSTTATMSSVQLIHLPRSLRMFFVMPCPFPSWI